MLVLELQTKLSGDETTLVHAGANNAARLVVVVADLPKELKLGVVTK